MNKLYRLKSTIWNLTVYFYDVCCYFYVILDTSLTVDGCRPNKVNFSVYLQNPPDVWSREQATIKLYRFNDAAKTKIQMSFFSFLNILKFNHNITKIFLSPYLEVFQFLFPVLLIGIMLFIYNFLYKYDCINLRFCIQQ